MSDRTPHSSSQRVSIPLGLLLVAIAVVLAASPALASPKTTDSQDAVDMLRRMVTWGSQVTYHGTQFVTVWDDDGGTRAVVAEVSHSPGRGTSYTIVGGSKQAILHDGLQGAAVLQLLLDGYEVADAGEGSVAGRPATIIDVLRDDGSRAARLWIDRDACLVLRREVYAPDGDLTRASGFIDLTVNAGWSAGKGTTASTRRASTAVPSDGPDVPEELAAGLTLMDVGTVTAGEHEATHLLYSDGLSAVSVFYQEGRLDAKRLDGFQPRTLGVTSVLAKGGPPAKATWSADGYVFTVVGDVSWATMREIVDALPHRPAPDNGVVARIGRGVERVSTWLNPFE